MKYIAGLSSSLNSTTTPIVCAAGFLTWIFSAMQCNKEYCYTVDNPIAQVALAGTLAFATVMAAISAPVVAVVEPITEKFNQAKTYLNGVFTSEKSATNSIDASPAAEKIDETATAAVMENVAANSIEAQAASLPEMTVSGFFSPKSDSVRANVSESSESPHRSRSPSPEHS